LFLAMGQLQSYPRNFPEKLELVIDGIVYDVTEFSKKHPGGSIIVEQLNPKGVGFPADATHAYRMLHGHSERPGKVLKLLNLQGKTRELTEEEKQEMAKKRPYDEKLSKSFDRITKELEAQGLFNYSYFDMALRQLELVVFLTFGLWCAVSPGEYFGWWTGAISCGIFMQRVGWFQHECNHGSTSKNHFLNNVIGMIEFFD
jgi:fatty acid desaturase 2 (delta-6 desaturase)